MKKGRLKIVIISHALVIPVSQNRWKRLAQDSNYEVHLIVPEIWEQTWFGEKVVYNTEKIETHNFNVHPLPTTTKNKWSVYLFKSFDAKLKTIQPDLIYIIHEEGVLLHQQIYLYKHLFARQAKVIFFSMNALGIPGINNKNIVKRTIRRLLWNNVKKNTDAALVHYPGCLASLRNGGYDKPIFLQTQIGVDETLFEPNETYKKDYKELLNLEDKFVIGYTGRLSKDKGVDDLVDVFIKLKVKYKSVALLLVGNGELKNQIEATIKKHNLAPNDIQITGFVDQSDVPKFMNAMDIFVLGSRTTAHWIDTFPLVTVQAQAIKLPVIASDSGSIPWQLADSAKIYPEGDRNSLKDALIDFIENENLRSQYAQKGHIRSLGYFCHHGMTENFKKIVNQVMTDNFIFHEKNETYTQWKAF